jgi:hypothetical protein
VLVCVFREIGNCVNMWCFLCNDCVCYSLKMEKSMVVIVISLVVLCGGNYDGSLLYLWVFCWRVSLYLALLFSSSQLW